MQLPAGGGDRQAMQRMLAQALMRGSTGAAYGPLGAATNALSPIAAQMIMKRPWEQLTQPGGVPTVPGMRGPTNMGFLL